MSTTTVTLGNRTFEIDEAKAREAYAAKKVINGRDTMFFNILPLKYQWAYELYKEMKNNHWEPEDISLRGDAAQWPSIPEDQQQAVKMLLGYQAMSGEITGAEQIYSIRDIVTAPELKLVFGRYVHEQNTQQDVLVHEFSSLGIDPSVCSKIFASSAAKLRHFSQKHIVELERDVDMNLIENKQALAKNTFLFSQCMEGLQFYSLYAVVLEMGRTGKLTGTAQILSNLLCDAGFRCELFRKLFSELNQENTDIRTNAFDAELVDLMNEAVELEKEFISQSLTGAANAGLDNTTLNRYIDYIASKRLAGCGLGPAEQSSPLPWLDEVFFPKGASQVNAAAIQSQNDFDDDDL